MPLLDIFVVFVLLVDFHFGRYGARLVVLILWAAEFQAFVFLKLGVELILGFLLLNLRESPERNISFVIEGYQQNKQ